MDGTAPGMNLDLFKQTYFFFHEWTEMQSKRSRTKIPTEEKIYMEEANNEKNT